MEVNQAELEEIEEKQQENERKEQERRFKKQNKDDKIEVSYTDGKMINQETGEPMSKTLFDKQFMDEFNREIRIELLMKKRDGENVMESEQKYRHDYLKRVEFILNRYGLYYHQQNDNSLNGL